MCLQVRDPEDGDHQGGGHPSHCRHSLHQRLRTLPGVSGSVAQEAEKSLLRAVKRRGNNN